MRFLNISDITKSNLCTRCGTCFAACPHNAIDLDSNYYPVLNSNCTNCSLCVQACPGWDFDYNKYSQTEPPNNQLEGFYKDIYLCQAANKSIREMASGGGIVTGLLYFLFSNNIISGAVVASPDKKEPWKTNAYLATSIEDILASHQSKYTIVPMNKVLSEIKGTKGKVALVALPCQIQGFHKLCSLNEDFKEKIYITIGLYCHLNMENSATTTLIRNKGIDLKDVAKLEYRGGSWPGRIRVTLKNGSIINLHSHDIKDGALNYLKRLFVAPRCLLCIDASAELADISIADAWIRNSVGHWLMENKGRWSIILERTERGKNLINRAIKEGAVEKMQLDRDLILSAHSSMIKEKKSGATIRIAKLKAKNLPCPNYHISPYEITLKNRLSEYLYQLTLLPRHFRLIRKFLMIICFSKLGGIFTTLKLSWKSWKRKVNIKNEK